MPVEAACEGQGEPAIVAVRWGIGVPEDEPQGPCLLPWVHHAPLSPQCAKRELGIMGSQELLALTIEPVGCFRPEADDFCAKPLL